ncbi:hypothetical protein [Streptomyces pactum]|uniref:hypothetical protein n=1 Tax=Streptomyces pactum TaxID=68249 RepID=UPI002D21B744|nr:hypothetical protein [Streptomyces pactum]
MAFALDPGRTSGVWGGPGEDECVRLLRTTAQYAHTHDEMRGTSWPTPSNSTRCGRTSTAW